MPRPKPEVRARWRPFSVRQLAAGLFLAALAGTIVGCGGGERPAGPVAVAPAPATPKAAKPSAVPLTVEDVETPPLGLDSSVTPAHSSDRLAEATTDSKTTEDPVGTPDPKNDPAAFAPPGVLVQSAGGKAAESEKRNLVATATSDAPATGRSGTTKNLLLQRAGGRAAAEPRPILRPPGDWAEAAKGKSGEQPGVGLPPPPPVAAAAKPPGGGNPADPSSAETYNLYRENEYRSPLAAKFSTFSADVNTASYSNVRRFLTEGRLPPKDAVFLAEFVNYFPYQYAGPTGDDPVAFHLELGPCPWNRRHHLVRVGVQAKQLDPKDMPPRNLTFLIDTSGSMNEPNKLPLLQKSLGLLVDGLNEKDTVGIVTYAGTAGVALEPTSGREKEKIRKVVDALGAGGSTNGEGGLKAAYDLARRTFDEKAVNRVILCTDGDFNVGVSGQGDLVRLIETQRKSDVFLTVLGFGMGNYKDGTLKELANHGNGHHAYIDTLDEAKKVFVEQGGALVLVAKDVKFQVEFNPGRVAAYRLVGYENRLLKDEDFKNDAKDAGDMGSGHQVTALYEIVPVGVPINLPGVDAGKYQTPAAPNPKAPDEWLTVAMRYKHPEADTSKELSKPLKGDVAVKDLSDDFRFAAAAASFGMLLRDSEFKGGMTYAGVIEEAQGAVGKDPGGHRAAFLELAKKAQEIAKPKAPAAAATLPAN